MSSVIWVSEPLQQVLLERLSSARMEASVHGTVVSSVKDFLEATRDPKAIAFVDATTMPTLAKVDHVPLPGLIIGVCDDALQTAVGWVGQHPWVSHVMSTAILEHPIGDELLDNVVRTLRADEKPRLLDWLGPTMEGRRIRLTHASRRAARLERMSEFFESNGVGSRTVEQLRDAAEELLTNAFYDAPVAAGAVKNAISREQDIALPDDSACDLAYGCREDLAVVRVRDPFGSLSRRRLVEVLGRCARTDMAVEVDESMGGAGLGMWRIFSAASFVAISVIKGRHTEILVGIAKRAAGAAARPYAFHFFFSESAKRRFWKQAKEDTNTPSLINQSVMIVTRSK